VAMVSLKVGSSLTYQAAPLFFGTCEVAHRFRRYTLLRC
jgi:hypothetical protein